MIVKHSDLASCRFCNRGARQFFERNGLSWQDFMANGIDSSDLEKFDDAMVRTVVARAQKREEAGE